AFRLGGKPWPGRQYRRPPPALSCDFALFRLSDTLVDMNGMTRRQLSAASLGMLAAGARGSAHFTQPLGAELYTVRNVLPAAAGQTLKSIAAIGYREVEADRSTLLQIAPLLKQYGLKPVSIHIETPLITGAWKPWIGRAAERKTPLAGEGST